MARASVGSAAIIRSAPPWVSRSLRMLSRVLLGPEQTAAGGATAARATPTVTSEAAQAGKISDWLRLD